MFIRIFKRLKKNITHDRCTMKTKLVGSNIDKMERWNAYFEGILNGVENTETDEQKHTKEDEENKITECREEREINDITQKLNNNKISTNLGNETWIVHTTFDELNGIISPDNHFPRWAVYHY